MKKSILLLSVLALFLGACSTKNGIAMKRKYNNGYYVSLKHKQHNVAVKETVVNTNKEKIAVNPITPALLPVSTQEAQPQLYASIKNNVVSKKNGIKNTTSHKENESTIISKITNVNNTKTATSSKRLMAKPSSKAESSGGVDLVILIILCFFPFINLISIYLKDGKSFTMNFWIDLILDCLFFLPGIVFALLVVLDVVNLA